MRKMTLQSEAFTVFSYFLILTLIATFLFSFILGVSKTSTLRGETSTAIGMQGTFKRSNVTATMKSYERDENGDVLIATISVKENPNSPLPYKASDYLVTHNGKKVMNAYFGRYSTDGDFYFIIPYPKEGETYHIQVTNKNFLGENKESKTNNLTELAGSLSSQLSSVTSMGSAVGETDSDKESKTDSIAFQMTVSPKLKDKKYQAKVIKTKSHSLLIKKKNGEVAFDFESYWNYMYKEPLIEAAEKNIETSIKNEAAAQDKYDEATERYERNNNDENAKQQMARLSEIIQKEKDNQKEYSRKLNSYRSLKFNPDDFSDYSTEVYGIGE